MLLFYRITATARQLVWPGLVGLVAVIGHYMVTRARDYLEAWLLAPRAYAEMVMVIICGWWFFGPLPEW